MSTVHSPLVARANKSLGRSVSFCPFETEFNGKIPGRANCVHKWKIARYLTQYSQEITVARPVMVAGWWPHNGRYRDSAHQAGKESFEKPPQNPFSTASTRADIQCRSSIVEAVKAIGHRRNRVRLPPSASTVPTRRQPFLWLRRRLFVGNSVTRSQPGVRSHCRRPCHSSHRELPLQGHLLLISL